MKITEVTEVESNSNASSLAEQDALELFEEDSIKVTLGGSQAIFRLPTAIDLMQAEIDSTGIVNDEFSTDFYRSLAKITCTKWGSKTSVPDDSTIKAKDDNAVVIAFINYFKSSSLSSENSKKYCEVIPNGSSKPDFDLVVVTLSNGDQIKFDEPSMSDNKIRENASTNIEGIILIASNLCRSWGTDNDLSLAEIRLKVNRLPLADFLRVSKGLSFFSVAG